jgi:hypothetical protein
MVTFTTETAIKDLIANHGYYPGDPRVIRIVEYLGRGGYIVWGVVYETEPESMHHRYEVETAYVRNPKVIWSAK